MGNQIRPAIKPTFGDVGGEYWDIDIESYKARRPGRSQMIRISLIRCPKAHPAWEYWVVGLIHLRDEPGVAPSLKLYPEATHEILAVALDPAAPLPSLEDFDGYKYLTPIDQSVQFHVPTDAHAAHVFMRMLELCCEGFMSPDSDCQSTWASQSGHLAAHQRGEHGGKAGGVH